MDRIKNFLTGSAEGDYDNDGVTPRRSGSNNGSRYGYRDNTGNNFTSTRRYKYSNNSSSMMNDDMYLYDDDEWGMSALSTTQPPSYRDDSGGGSSSAFWDQKSASLSFATSNSNNNNNINAAAPRGPPPPVASNRSGLQEWEREAMMRDNLEDAFEIGNEDYYHSETTTANRAYDEVQEELTSLEEAADDNASQGSAKSKDEVVNAYRDYLKSIRDGGFESYLNTDDDYGTPDFTNIGNTTSNSSEIDQTTERSLDIEEERHQSLYGDLYGVRDVRRSSESPYAAWRARARTLLRTDEERETMKAQSPSRRILNNFRRKRSSQGSRGERSVNSNQSGGDSSRHSSNNGGHHHHERSRLDDFYRYKNAVLYNPRFQRTVFIICLILGLSGGLSYYGKTANLAASKDNGSIASDEVTDVEVPPKPEDDGIPQNNQQRPHTNQQPPPEQQSLPNSQVDAIKNAMKTFDPTWYNRMSGWEGITYADALDFCSEFDRVPCSYEIYCNDGPDGLPYGGIRPNGEQWAPVSNGENQYVQVGDQFTCSRYTDTHNKMKPEWGLTGEAPEYEHGAGGITQNILCCRDVSHLITQPVTEWGGQDAIDNKAEDMTMETTNSAMVNVEETVVEDNRGPTDGNKGKVSDNLSTQKREKAVIAAFQPIWFSDAHGWSQGSYEDAVNFCESYNHMVLCPYAAYCPNGPNQQPLPGSMILPTDGEEWVPANGPMNTWIQVGTINGAEDTRCTLHHELLGERPKWGTDKSRPDVKHHIMCCLM